MDKKVFSMLFSLLACSANGMDNVERYTPKYATITQACKNNDLEEVKRFLHTDQNALNYVDDTGKTSLHYACSLGFKDMALFLITHGALCGATTTDYKFTPLHYALYYGKKDLTKAFISCIKSHASIDNPTIFYAWLSQADDRMIIKLLCCFKYTQKKTLKFPKLVQKIIVDFVLNDYDFSPLLKKLIHTSSCFHHTEYLEEHYNQYDLDTKDIAHNEIGKCTPYELALKIKDPEIIELFDSCNSIPDKKIKKNKCSFCVIN